MGLKSDAAKEKAKDQLWRYFLGGSIFDFCNNIRGKADLAHDWCGSFRGLGRPIRDDKDDI